MGTPFTSIVLADGTDETANVKGVRKVPQKVPNEDRQRVQPFKKIMNISVVIPVYNAERYIKRCIEALLSQSYPEEDYEVIMADNCSTDASAAIIKRFPAICLLSEKKCVLGTSQHLNFVAIRELLGDLAFYVVDD